MSSKLGLIISLMFFALFFSLSIDVICIQYFYSDLDSKSVLIGYELGRMKSINDESIHNLEDKYHVNIKDISNKDPKFGDVIEYVITVNYQPIIVSNEVMELQISRSTVIGYY